MSRQARQPSISANTPPAKGRTEDAIQTLQDRLPHLPWRAVPGKEMRMLGIHSRTNGNAYLPKYMDDFNQHFVLQTWEFLKNSKVWI